MKKILFSILLIAFSCFSVMAQDLPEPMQPFRLVNDFAEILTPQQNGDLEHRLRQFADTTSTQIVVVTVKSLNGSDIEYYSERLANKWGIGQAGKDNGVLILVKPKTGDEKGEVRIEIGFGLEGAVPDVYASRIIRNEMIPEFRQNNYYGGISAAAQALMDLSKGEYKADEKDESSQTSMFMRICILMIIIIYGTTKVISKFGRHSSGGGFYSGGSCSSSSWGSFSSGGGDFGGFSGGSFGGGGSSGSW